MLIPCRVSSITSLSQVMTTVVPLLTNTATISTRVSSSQPHTPLVLSLYMRSSPFPLTLLPCLDGFGMSCNYSTDAVDPGG